MKIEFAVNNSSSAAARYLTWSLSPLRLRLLDAAPSSNAVTVSLSEERDATGGSIRFCEKPGDPPKASLKVSMPANGSSGCRVRPRALWISQHL